MTNDASAEITDVSGVDQISDNLTLKQLSCSIKDFEKSFRLEKTGSIQQKFATHFTNIRNNFLRQLKFDKLDGCKLATDSNDRTIRIFNLPIADEILDKGINDELASNLQIVCPSIVYDMDWLPFAIESDGQKLASVCQKSPIQLWDAKDGSLLSSYYALSFCNEIETIYSFAFVGFLGQQMVAGMNRNLAIFDINRPNDTFRLANSLKGERQSKSQDGIISCLANSPVDSHSFAAGSYGKQIGIYDVRHDLRRENLLLGLRKGVSFIKYDSMGFLFSANRKDEHISGWDLRMPNREVVARFARTASTNQRMAFDLCLSHKRLVSGDSDGNLNFWCTDRSDDKALRPRVSIPAHNDCLNCVSYHPQTSQIIATASGQRHFPKLKATHDCDSVDSSSEADISLFDYNIVSENSLKFWMLTDINEKNQFAK